MRFPKLLPLMFLLAASSVSAQSVAFSGLAKVGSSIGGVFSGIFDGISGNPAVWMKVILIIILYIIFQMLVVGKLLQVDTNHPKKGAVTTLSLVLAIGMVAPVPSSIIVALFTGLQFMGLVFYVAPVFGIMIWTHKMTAKDAQNQDPARSYVAMALILWILTLFGYINGLGFATDVPNVDLAAGILNFVAIIAIIWYTMKLITVSGKHSVNEGWPNLFGPGNPPGMPPIPPGTSPQGPFSRMLNSVNPFHHKTAEEQAAAKVAEDAKAAESQESALKLGSEVFSGFDRSINALAGAVGNVQQVLEQTAPESLVDNSRVLKANLAQVSSALTQILKLEQDQTVLVRVDRSKTLVRDLKMYADNTAYFAGLNYGSLDESGRSEFVQSLKAFYGKNGSILSFITNFKAQVTRDSLAQAYSIKFGWIASKLASRGTSPGQVEAAKLAAASEERITDDKKAILADLRLVEHALLQVQLKYMQYRRQTHNHAQSFMQLKSEMATLIRAFAGLLDQKKQKKYETYLSADTRQALVGYMAGSAHYEQDIKKETAAPVEEFFAFFGPSGMVQRTIVQAIDELKITWGTWVRDIISDVFGPTFARLDQINAIWSQWVGAAEMSRQGVRNEYVSAFVRTNSVAIKTILGELTGYQIDWTKKSTPAQYRASRDYLIGKLQEFKPFLEKIDEHLAQDCEKIINTFKNASSKGQLVMAGQVYDSFLPRVSALFANAGLAA